MDGPCEAKNFQNDGKFHNRDRNLYTFSNLGLCIAMYKLVQMRKLWILERCIIYIYIYFKFKLMKKVLY